ncbi:uncharacterized protein LOC103064059 [Python bivittatus]|uniref:Uncharacterized protein LOC103064059 n=1 Tax=Python bivittatus TaxID=176946 RepID=A0A9F5IKC7_PYTBI|nr:uncharacterized protein LOC103064059 [Python bivittatus]
MVEKEPEGKPRMESSLLLGSLADEQPSSEQTHGGSEESPSGSLGKGTSASQKRKNKKKNKNKTLPDSELHNALSSLSSAPSSLECSLTPNTADVKIPLEESQHSEETTSTSDESLTHPVSKEDMDNRTSDHNINVTPSEDESTGSSTEYQNSGMKRSLPESEVRHSNTTEVIEEPKRQKSASGSKKAKLEAAVGKNVSEEGEKTCTPVEESGEEKRGSATAGNQRQQSGKKAGMQEITHEVPGVKQRNEVEVSGLVEL